MSALFDKVSARCSKLSTRTYSTSFSLGIYCLDRRMHQAIYAIYGFVRLADEIVDSFHGHDQAKLLHDFERETYEAIAAGISLNPILHGFQRTVNRYGIDHALIDKFLRSMEMDLHQSTHDPASFDDYIVGSAEVVGLMCLHVFCAGDRALYNSLEPAARRLGAAFQKVNFLRDLRHDHQALQRAYFPGVDIRRFAEKEKRAIEAEIHDDFRAALQGIRRLPRGARFGVYVAYVYYRALLERIECTPARDLLRRRLRIPNLRKFMLLIQSYFKYRLGLL
jgi:phytoene/squalene synthetase